MVGSFLALRSDRYPDPRPECAHPFGSLAGEIAGFSCEIGRVRVIVRPRPAHRRGGRVVYSVGLENRSRETDRGFESHPLRHRKSLILKGLQRDFRIYLACYFV